MKRAAILLILSSACGGSVTVSDPDGLGGIKIRGELAGPASATLDVPALGVSDASTEGTLALILFLSTEAPAGRYTAMLVATDT